MRICHMFAVLVLAVFVTSAAAGKIEVWSYNRLFKEADVIVIASAQETVATDDKASDERWQKVLIGQNTTFSVIDTLKGHVDAGPIKVRHFKLKDDHRMRTDGPILVAFRTKGPTIEGGRSEKYTAILDTPQYLLFLKRCDDGRFEPVSGQIDPALSVKEIYAPLPAVMDKK